MAKKKESLTPEQRLQAALVPESEQPYKVPENWCWIRLGYSVNLFNGDRGSNYPSKKDYQPDGIPFINAGAIVNGELSKAEFNYISEEKYNALRAGKIKQGDILYCLRGSLGKTAMVQQNFKGAISSSLCILRTNKSILKEFLYYLLLSNVISHQQDLAENGSAQPNLSAASVVEYMIPLPPLLEQQRIVARIESLFAKLDEAKQKAQDALDSFELRKAAILHKAFTGELTAQWRKEHGVGMESWEKSKLGKYANTQYGYTDSASQEKIGPKFLRITDIQNGAVNWNNVPYCKISDEEFTRYAVLKNDIMIARTGATTGKSYLIVDDVRAVFAYYLIRLTITSPNLSPKYLYTFMQSQHYWGQITEFSAGIAQPGVNAKKLKEIDLPIPSIIEQSEIVRILDDLLGKEQQAKEAAETVLEQIDLIKKSILARAFRGELGTNDPTEESAKQLLLQVLQ